MVMAARYNRKVMEGIITTIVMMMGVKKLFCCLIKPNVAQFHIKAPLLLFMLLQFSCKNDSPQRIFTLIKLWIPHSRHFV